jgi:hypothetical protein
MKGRTNLCLNWSKRGCPVRRKGLTRMTASTPVPDEGELRLGTVRLPMGRQLQTENSDGEPVAWRTQAPVPDPGPVWSTLSALHRQTGLVPVLEPVGRGDLEVSFWDTAAVADVDQVDVAASSDTSCQRMPLSDMFCGPYAAQVVGPPPGAA